jgi:hypothetical protein
MFIKVPDRGPVSSVMEKIYIIIHFTLCFFVDLENFGHEKEAEEEMEEEKADAVVEDATLEDVTEYRYSNAVYVFCVIA